MNRRWCFEDDDGGCEIARRFGLTADEGGFAGSMVVRGKVERGLWDGGDDGGCAM